MAKRSNTRRLLEDREFAQRMLQEARAVVAPIVPDREAFVDPDAPTPGLVSVGKWFGRAALLLFALSGAAVVVAQVVN